MKSVKLGEIADIKTGRHDANHGVEKGTFPFFTCALEPSRANTFSFDGSCIILPGNGANVGEVLFHKGKLEAYQRTYIIHNLEEYPRYIYLYLKHKWKRYIENKQVGSATNYIKMGNLTDFEIPLPSLSKQKAIVAKLDRAQRLIDIDREMLAKYDELIQSVFLEMFGDPKSNSKKIKTGKLGDFAFINMGQSPKGSSYNEEGEGEPLLNGPTEFGEKYPMEKQWTTEPKKFAEEDDILFCVRGATAGRTNLADKKYCIGRGLAAIRGEEKLDTTFIHFVLKSHYDYFQNKGQGSTFINIAKKDLSNLKVPIPSQEMQSEFISTSKQIENQKQVTKASQKKSEELFSSLVQEVFC